MSTLRKRRRIRIGRIFCTLLLLAIVVTLGMKVISDPGSPVPEILPSPAQVESEPPQLESTPAAPAKFRIVIDAGHGGKDPGATGVSGAYEKEFNLALAKRVYELLEKEPMFDIRMTRLSDEFIELEERAAIANDWNADALVSIHGNTYESQAVSGTESLYYYEDSIELAQTLQSKVAAALGIRDRGIKEQQLVILSAAQVPAVVVEMGYLTNPEEEKMLLSTKGQDRAANAILEGLKAYFGSKTPRNETVSQRGNIEKEKTHSNQIGASLFFSVL